MTDSPTLQKAELLAVTVKQNPVNFNIQLLCHNTDLAQVALFFEITTNKKGLYSIRIRKLPFQDC
jgi:hypothetical protein